MTFLILLGVCIAGGFLCASLLWVIFWFTGVFAFPTAVKRPLGRRDGPQFLGQPVLARSGEGLQARSYYLDPRAVVFVRVENIGTRAVPSFDQMIPTARTPREVLYAPQA